MTEGANARGGECVEWASRRIASHRQHEYAEQTHSHHLPEGREDLRLHRIMHGFNSLIASVAHNMMQMSGVACIIPESPTNGLFSPMRVATRCTAAMIMRLRKL